MRETLGCARSTKFPCIAIMGSQGVGKTAIAVRYLTGRFIGEYASGTEITYQHVVNYFSKRTNTVNLVDTTSMNGSDWCSQPNQVTAFLVVYSITDNESLKLAGQILANLPTSAPKLLLANKMDLEHQRAVSISDGPALAESYHVPHYQVSAAESDVNIKSAMHSLIRQLLLRSSVIPSTFLPIASITKMLSSLLSKSNRPTKEVKSVSSFSLVSPTSSPEHSKLLITNNRHKIAIHKKLGLHSFNLLESRRSRWLSGREHKGAMKSLLLN